jgi:hypothetical protein
LIGWTYLICALLFILFKRRFLFHVSALIFFMALNAADSLHWLSALSPLRTYLWVIGSGSFPTMAMAGVIGGIAFQKAITSGHYWRFQTSALMAAILFLAYAFITRPWWGINKIQATPSWVAICTGLSIIAFCLLSWLMDSLGRRNWYKWLKPAGTSTLTCYLLPYLHYPIFSLIGVRLPLLLRTGIVGIGKSLTYSFLIILLAGVLEKRNIKLKL